MSALEDALHAHLSADPAIAGLVGTEIYPDLAAQGSPLPRIVYTVITTEHAQHMTAGASRADAAVQIDAYAATNSERRAICEAVRERLQAYRGTMGALVPVDSVTITGPASTHEIPIHGDEIGLFRGRMEARIWYEESAPPLGG